jgi:hypothetical protein
MKQVNTNDRPQLVQGEEDYKAEEILKQPGTKSLFAATTTVMLAILGLFIGLGAWYFTNNTFRQRVDSFVENENRFVVDQRSDNVSVQPGDPTDVLNLDQINRSKAADFRVHLNSLNKQNVTLITTSMRSAIDTKPDLFAAKSALDKNTVEISESIGNIYGNDARERYLELWRNHTNELLNYSLAVKKGDNNLIKQASENLNNFIENYSTFMSSLNQELKKEDVKSLTLKYIDDMKAVVEAYVPCEFEASVRKQTEGYKQMEKMSDNFAIAIVNQKPDKFN